ncbi:sulfatase-like hydrolase/transferase [uncultured Algibacter sp.]|uniref:sulfatase-like hydrolase/transferase n=1 Tax=uncultured Algibacter sp. TaxID=298659 RepID=UPI00262FDA1A|nr:sulfatase-like hydrolase/transferase [uncultured Algibacter sp.]
MFKTNFSSSAIFVALDSNLGESKEFINVYVKEVVIVFGVVMFILVLIVLFNFIKNKSFVFKTSKPSKIKASILFVSILIFLKFSLLVVYNLPYLIVKSSMEYYVESEKMEKYSSKKRGNFNNVKTTSFDEDEQQVYVILIGESTSSKHMGIYDYYRNTTPLLCEIKDDLIVYNNVVSPNSYTVASLSKALTLGNYENPNAKFDGSIIQLLNQAEYQTYWVSNQKPMGLHDSQISKIGLGADKTYFLNIKHPDESTNYDEILVEKLEDILLEKAKKKVIFLHMLGTHMDYQKRYPDNFKTFVDTPIFSKFKSEDAHNTINAYDNAVKYLDYIIREVIDSVKKLNVNSFVLYFSDHGEEVYDSLEFMGHSTDQVITENIYKVPMLLWVSEKYKKNNILNSDIELKYMTDDLFHSIADLTNIESAEVDSTRSLFNNHFKERKRFIADTIDFDDFFK